MQIRQKPLGVVTRMEVGLIVPTSSAYVAEARAAIVLSAR
jgi:hypothetical protein